MRTRKEEFKPLLFTTTLRNPERIIEFLDIITEFNGANLTNEVINKIVFKLVKKKIYVPIIINRTNRLKSQLDNGTDFSDKDTNYIIEQSPQKHKEAGFDKGWPSRFDTWYKFLKELGFMYYKMNEPIEISESGLQLLKAKQEGYEHLEQQVFLSAFAKYQRNNPYRRISNKNRPLILLLNTIVELKRITGDESACISIKELPLLICWKDDDYSKVVQKIVEIRKNYGFKPSNEYIYSICKDILGLTVEDEKRFKISNLLKELPDEFIRKMRLTGLITIRGAGRFIDTNTLEKNRITYVIEHYADNIQFTDEYDYFKYMRTLDLKLISLERDLVISTDKKRKMFMKWVDTYDLETLKHEIGIVSNSRGKSSDNLLKFIDGPIRLEFLTAMILQKRFVDILVKPNYTVDDEGIPTSFAQGNTPDIECLDKQGNVLFEVTLLTGAQQCIREMLAIERHLTDCKNKVADSFSVILAPNIHSDTIKYSKFVKFKAQLDIIPLDIPTFSNSIDKINNIREYRISQ